MSLFGGVIAIKDIATILVVVFGVLFAGYALGRITIKGISLGSAGVFIQQRIDFCFHTFCDSSFTARFRWNGVFLRFLPLPVRRSYRQYHR